MHISSIGIKNIVNTFSMPDQDVNIFFHAGKHIYFVNVKFEYM